MRVAVNMSREVYEYYKGHDLSLVADTLMEMYDFTNLPPICAPREVERVINVSNETYISLYNTLGPRSKKLSLGRLFAFGYNMNVLSLPRFQTMRITEQKDNPTISLLNKAYKTLLDAQKYDESEFLKDLTSLVYNYKRSIEDETQKDETYNKNT